MRTSRERETILVYSLGATKVILVFHHPFWENSDDPKGQIITTDRPSKVMYFLKHRQKSGVGVVLASYVWDTDSTRFVGMNHDEIIEVCVTRNINTHVIF